MADYTEYIIVAPDGTQVHVHLPADLSWARSARVPESLLSLIGIKDKQFDDWTLLKMPAPRAGPVSASIEHAPQVLLLVRSFVAAAGNAPSDPRQARLKTERLRLERLNQESDYVRVEPLDVLGGDEPEHYRVTFLCRGITGIDADRKPIYGDKHEVEILCDDDFPSDVPRMRWVTPIWHPNIQHHEPKGVCVNKPEWLGGMGLDDLCRLMFEMVQYKNYHAVFTQPYPLDHEVAKWVLEYAEPHGIVDKKRSIFVDDKPFTRPTETRFISVSKAVPRRARIKVMPTSSSPDSRTVSRIRVTSPSSSSDVQLRSSQSSKSRIKIVKKNV
jgi:ubiquitin-protein ligase